MSPRLFDFLNKPKYQILFYLLKYEKISTSNSKNKIAKSFGYQSVGHFWLDFEDLLNNKLIIITKGNYVLGAEGRKELRFFTSLQLGMYFLLALIFIFFYYYYLSLSGLQISGIIYLMIALMLMFVVYIFYITLKTFTPKLPNTVRDLKNR